MKRAPHSTTPRSTIVRILRGSMRGVSRVVPGGNASWRKLATGGSTGDHRGQRRQRRDGETDRALCIAQFLSMGVVCWDFDGKARAERLSLSAFHGFGRMGRRSMISVYRTPDSEATGWGARTTARRITVGKNLPLSRHRKLSESASDETFTTTSRHADTAGDGPAVRHELTLADTGRLPDRGSKPLDSKHKWRRDSAPSIPNRADTSWEAAGRPSTRPDKRR
jgi:hypothetical protein